MQRSDLQQGSLDAVENIVQENWTQQAFISNYITLTPSGRRTTAKQYRPHIAR